MNSRLYIGNVMHRRLTPVDHAFTYPIYTCVFDLDELPALGREVSGFAHNRFGIAAIHDRDYLRGDGTLRERLMRILEANGCADGIERIEIVTMPRVFHYVFNPVSFYYGYRADGSLRCAVAEVNNTFREKHVYILNEPLGEPGAYPVRFRHAKQFHVSPFNNTEGFYEFSLGKLGERMDIGVDLVRDGQTVIVTRLTGQAAPMSDGRLLRTVLRHPLTVALNFPRITREAAVLYVRKKLPVFHKPNPTHPMTIGHAPPTLSQKIGRRALMSFFGRLRQGSLEVQMPDGTSSVHGDPSAARRYTLRLHNYDLFSRVLRDGDIGFGESYMHGDWDTDDLTGLLRFFVDNSEAVQSGNVAVQGLARAGSRIRHALNRNTLLGSRRNIEAHYDLGNDFYRTFLDPETLLYSSAVFEQPGDTLETAQKHKLTRLIRKARLQPGQHVLEIGCGWGGFAIEAVRQTGCRVTGITLSQEQFTLARERVQAAGLDDRIDIRICDYRHVEGQFDRIVSIEMLEAVGHEYFGSFFAACDRALKPDGLVVLQVITIPDQRYDSYRKDTDWIQKHIFPGGVLPSLTALSRAMTKHSRFFVEDLDNIGPHYAPTLAAWRQRFDAHHDELLRMGYDEVFQRKWRYYLCYCEAGFAARYINDLHLVLTRPHNRGLDAGPR